MLLPPRRRGWPVAGLVTALLLSGAACSASSASPSPTATVAPPSASNAPASTSPTPTAEPSMTPASAPKPKHRTTKELRGALLKLQDLPAGFEVSKDQSGDDGSKLSSSKAACKPLVKLLNQAKLPNSTATATVSFAGGQDGPFVDEDIDALGTKKAAGALIDTYRDAAASCRSFAVTFAGEGSSTVQVRKISFDKLADETVAVRFSANGGPLDSFETIQVGVALGDVVIGLNTIGLEGSDTQAAAEDAVKKAEKKLGTGRSI